MQRKLPFALVAVTATLVMVLSSASAHADRFPNGHSYYGQAAQAANGGRIVDVDGRRNVRVPYGETVTFRSGARQFAWTFNGLDRRAVDLSKLAPAGFTSKPFIVYIAEDPSKLS